MNLLKGVAILIISLVVVSCYPGRKMAETNIAISPLSEKTSIRAGSIVYGLPRSVFTIVVEMERTIEIPGPYWRYAADLLGLDNIIREESENWTIEGISVETHEEIDPSQFYIVESNSQFQTNVLSLMNEGLILDLDPQLYYSLGNKTESDRSGKNNFYALDLGSDEYFMVQRDTAFRRVSVDSTFIRIPYIVEKKKKLSDEQLAERAARRLMEMRDGKHLILTGEANVFPQSDAAINEMNRLEKEYTELFTGKTYTETRKFTYQIVPSKDMTGKQVNLFQFSELTGPGKENSKTGDPVILELAPEKKTDNLNFISKVQPESDEENAIDKLFYRVPDVVNMRISLDNEVLFNSRRLIYQFGEVVRLPANYLIGR